MTRSPLNFAVIFFLAFQSIPMLFAVAEQPNVVLIMTDDQGFGDLGFTGNPIIETPHIDRLAGESIWMKNFYVSPVCAPTRASLLTGRHSYRTKVVDTWIGRAMMDPGETTIAEILSDAGYATGIFGKWHLGDCYPMRPQDQGFDTSVVHRGGGIGQPADPQGAEGKYTNPILLENGIETQFSGYCTDIYVDNAIDFMKASVKNEKPFFIYLADNCPHSPFHDVPEDWLEHYKSMDLENDQFPSTGNEMSTNPNLDARARIFAMISNSDAQFGRLLKSLDEQGIAKNTIVIFLTDNGPNQARYNAGFRGSKTSVYEGGVRSPFFIRWPAKFVGGQRTEIAAHIDVLPTLVDACKAQLPADIKIDGRSFLPLLNGENTAWPERSIIIQSHRGDVPKPRHHFMIRRGEWKMVHHTGFNGDTPTDYRFELFNLEEDPFEQSDLAAEHPQRVASLLREYDDWFEEVGVREDNFEPHPIEIGTDREPVTVLTRQDWRSPAVFGTTGCWGKGCNGNWLISFAEKSRYRVECRFKDMTDQTHAILEIDDLTFETSIENGLAIFEDIEIPNISARLRVHSTSESTSASIARDAWMITVSRTHKLDQE